MALRRLSLAGIMGLLLAGLIVLPSILAPLIAPYDPLKQEIRSRYKPPSMSHPLGTDAYGRDMLSRVLFGGRTTILVAALSVATAVLVGVLLGGWIGYKGGWMDLAMLWICDIFLSYSSLVIGIVIVVSLGTGFYQVVIALAVALAPRFTRLVRGMMKSERERDYVLAAKAIGASTARVLFVHVIRNIAPTLIITVTMFLGTAIRLVAGLSFLGLGIPAPHPCLGGLIRDGTDALLFAPHVAIFPGIAVFLAILGFTMLGDEAQRLASGRG